MTRLLDEIVRLIRLDGPMPVARYMQLCLTHPAYGYYVTRDPFGSGGDFVTAPEISQMFGELIGLWAAGIWHEMRRPSALRLVELGPGRGTLMADALRAVRVLPDFARSIEVHMVEASPVLRAAQEKALASAGACVRWHAGLEDVPPGPAIVIANEFFDALPVRQFERRDSQWHERLIGLSEDGKLAWCLDAAPAALPSLGLRDDVPDKTVAEISAKSLSLMSSLSRRLQDEGGAALLIDYGERGPPLGDTLQAVRAHRFADPLQNPGEADLTVQVRFDALAAVARAAGAQVHGPRSQAAFLEALGIEARAERLMASALPAQAAAIQAATRRLTDRSAKGMGALFKAMAVTRAGMQSPPGFD